MTNADEMPPMRLNWNDHYIGCGFCGASWRDYEAWPNCCPQMIAWKQRQAAQYRAHVPTAEQERAIERDHIDLRWQRVVRRLAAKGGP